jgi:hypothetical protein
VQCQLNVFRLPSIGFTFANSALSAITSSVGKQFTAIVTEADLTSTAPTATPEPSTMLLFGVGMLGLAGHRWRRSGTGGDRWDRRLSVWRGVRSGAGRRQRRA